MLRGDNQAALYRAEKPGKHSNTKHINNKYHLVRHLVEDGKLRTLHVPTNDNTADIMTKPLATANFGRTSKCCRLRELLLLPQTPCMQPPPNAIRANEEQLANAVQFSIAAYATPPTLGRQRQRPAACWNLGARRVRVGV
ncbi:hypothetical protein PR003_g26892 [Phytophthora rubi]|uniref:Reverse transcriptase Ty1/copia-type domain-containing protein n=1 Tax=Phytophthora rubi TaxID=129364 RepID=A0A6A3I0B2_9STRA|nr:hypothetical protein PR001_g25645 [Phytophthora rubi]KAE9284280.1 hypothetical protein PR003_g26892 [Phytophthora rubi]